MSIINETKKYLHMLVKILVFILILCAFKLVESFFEVKRMPEMYVISYFVFAYFILARLFSERKEKIMIIFNAVEKKAVDSGVVLMLLPSHHNFTSLMVCCL